MLERTSWHSTPLSIFQHTPNTNLLHGVGVVALLVLGALHLLAYLLTAAGAVQLHELTDVELRRTHSLDLVDEDVLGGGRREM